MGTGYFVDEKIVADAGGWIFTGMTEDIQLTSYCYYHDVYMRYYPEVCFYDEQSTDFKTVHNQHLRWLAGYMQRRKFLKKAGVQYDYHPKNLLSFMNFEFNCGLIPFVIFNVLISISAVIDLVFGIISIFHGGNPQRRAGVLCRPETGCPGKIRRCADGSGRDRHFRHDARLFAL